MNSRLKNRRRGGALHFAVNRLLDLALVAALAATAAYWTWQLAAPPALAASAHALPAPAAEVSKPALFGASQPALATARIRLVGVVAPERALFRMENGKVAAARAGDALAPGLVLREVHAGHALVERNGVLERFALERSDAGR